MTEQLTVFEQPASSLDPLRRRRAAGRERHQAQPRQGRLGPSVVAALHLRSRRRSWTCRTSRSCPPAWTTGTGSGRRRDGIPAIHAPRLLEVVRMMLGHQVEELRPFPWQPKTCAVLPRGQRPGRAGAGVPAVAALHRLRLARRRSARSSTATPTRSGRTWRSSSTSRATADGAASAARRGRGSPCVPARYLLACTDGHLDEFPYELWVHRGQPCSAGADVPGAEDGRPHRGQGRQRGRSCASRAGRAGGMNEAQGEAGRAKLPHVPRAPAAPGRVRRRRLRRRDQADAGRGVQPVVPGDAVDHRHAAARRRGAATRPRRPHPAALGDEADPVCRSARHGARPARGGRTGRRHRAVRRGPGRSWSRWRSRRSRATRTARSGTATGTRSTCSCPSGATCSATRCASGTATGPAA